MKFLYACALSLMVLALNSCMTVSTSPLEQTKFDMGDKAAYYIHPSKVKLIAIDDTVLIFDVVAKVELSNPTDKILSFDVSCIFYRGHNMLTYRLVKDYRVPAGKNRLVKMTYHTRSNSVNGYYAKCKVRIFRLR